MLKISILSFYYVSLTSSLAENIILVFTNAYLLVVDENTCQNPDLQKPVIDIITSKFLTILHVNHVFLSNVIFG